MIRLTKREILDLILLVISIFEAIVLSLTWRTEDYQNLITILAKFLSIPVTEHLLRRAPAIAISLIAFCAGLYAMNAMAIFDRIEDEHYLRWRTIMQVQQGPRRTRSMLLRENETLDAGVDLREVARRKRLLGSDRSPSWRNAPLRAPKCILS